MKLTRRICLKKDCLKKFKDLGEAEQVYASIIAEGDEGVGRILKLLKELNIDENTLVVFSTDNGPEHSTDDKDHKGQGLGKVLFRWRNGWIERRKAIIVCWRNSCAFDRALAWNCASWKDGQDIGVNCGRFTADFFGSCWRATSDGLQTRRRKCFVCFQRYSDLREPSRFFGNGEAVMLSRILGLQSESETVSGSCSSIRSKNRAELYDLENDWAEKHDVTAKNPAVVQQLTRETRRLEKLTTSWLPAKMVCRKLERKVDGEEGQ